MFQRALSDFGCQPFSKRSSFVPSPPQIGHDVWIGSGVLFAHGVTVGNGAVIAARSIVTRDVPPFAIVAGSPGRIVKYRFSEQVIERIQRIAWWRYAFPQLKDINVDLPIDAYLDELEALIETGLQPAELHTLPIGSAIEPSL